MWIEQRYARLLDWTLAHRGTTLAIALVSFFGACGLGSQLGTEFFPPADEGIFFGAHRDAAGHGARGDRGVSRARRGVVPAPARGRWASSRRSGSGGGGNEAARHAETNMGMIFGTLKPREERERSVQELVRDARAELGDVPGRKIRIFNPSEMMTAGANQGSFEVEIRGNLELAELDELAQEMLRRLEALGGFVDLSTSLKLGLPEVRVMPDREKAASARRRRAHARAGDPDDGRRHGRRRLQGGRTPLRHPHAPRGGGPRAIPRRSGTSTCAARRRRDRAAQPRAHRDRRGAVGDHAHRPPATRHDRREPRGPHARLGDRGRAGDREGDPARGRDARALRAGAGDAGGRGADRSRARPRRPRDLHGAGRAVREPGAPAHRDAGAAARDDRCARRSLDHRPDAEPVLDDRHPAALRARHEELDPARGLRQPAAPRGHGQGHRDADRRARAPAAGADDRGLDDLRRAARGDRHRPRRRDARADGRRRRDRDVLVDVADAAVVPVFYILFDDAADWVKRAFRRVSGSSPEAPDAEKIPAS